MSNYATLKSAIQRDIKTNGNNEITGALLQQSLLSMINSLGVGYQFVGIATPSTNPGTPDQKVFYIANGKGTYTNFGGINVTEDEVIFLVLDDAWHKVATGIATGSGGSSVTVDSSLSSTSTNPVQNKAVKAALDAKQAKLTAGSGIIINGNTISATGSGGSSVTVDSSLSSTSTNPVQNKVVKAALDAKQDRMTIDSALNATSANPVQNKAVKAALDAKQAKLTAGSGIIINGSKISTAYKIWHGSQAEYDAIAAKDDMTIYLIEES
jgi:hypothetical protein